MDAPLSSFDPKRIDNICDVIPAIADQVILFINPKDGTIVKHRLRDKIGIEYHMYLVDDQKPLESNIEFVGESSFNSKEKVGA